LADKVMKHLEAKKAEVAQSMFNPVSNPEQETQPAAVETEDTPAEA
jgi:hypothetical protein